MRGDMYRLNAPEDAEGHEQVAERYGVVVPSGDVPWSTWVIAPTSTGRRPASFRPEFRPEIEINGTRARVMVEHLTVIDSQVRLGAFAGRLGATAAAVVDAALQVVLALD